MSEEGGGDGREEGKMFVYFHLHFISTSSQFDETY